MLSDLLDGRLLGLVKIYVRLSQRQKLELLVGFRLFDLALRGVYLKLVIWSLLGG